MPMVNYTVEELAALTAHLDGLLLTSEAGQDDPLVSGVEKMKDARDR